MNLSDIHTGDEIEYERIVGRSTIDNCTGKVISVSEKFISVQGKRYPDSILINDLKSGRAKIVGIKIKEDEKDMPREKFEVPTREELKAVQTGCQNMSELARKLGVGPTTARTWLLTAGLPTRFTYKSVTEPEKTVEPSHNDHIAETSAAISPDNIQAESNVADNIKKDIEPEKIAIHCEDCGGIIAMSPGDMTVPRYCDDCWEIRQPRKVETVSPHPTIVPEIKTPDFTEMSVDAMVDVAVKAMMHDATTRVRNVIKDPMAIMLLKSMIEQGIV